MADETKVIPESEWKAFGNAAHLCVADHCRFHITTMVGSFIISTVGEYVPDSTVREILARSRGLHLTGMGDEREADWMEKNGYEPLGAGPHPYETLVFVIDPAKLCACGCGMPEVGGLEVSGLRWMTRGEANQGHRDYCYRAARGEFAAKAEGRNA